MSAQARKPYWVGDYMAYWGDIEWDFHTCVRCEGPLRSSLARKNGYGPDCAQIPGIESYVRKARAQDHENWHNHITALSRGEPVASIAPHNRSARKAATGNSRRQKPLRKPKPPSVKQQNYLRFLAMKTGTTFETPRSSRDASLQIDQLKLMLAGQGRRGAAAAS